MGLFKPKRPSQYPSTLLWFFDQVSSDLTLIFWSNRTGQLKPQTHVTVTATTALVLVLTRNAHVAWFSIGALGSSLTGTSLQLLLLEAYN